MACRPPLAWPDSTLTPLELTKDTSRSERPSPLKSATASACGETPKALVVGTAKLPPPVFLKTETVWEVKLPTAKSRRPSPLKSPTATVVGLVPTAKFVGVWKVPSPLPSTTLTVPGKFAAKERPNCVVSRDRLSS